MAFDDNNHTSSSSRLYDLLNVEAPPRSAAISSNTKGPERRRATSRKPLPLENLLSVNSTFDPNYTPIIKSKSKRSALVKTPTSNAKKDPRKPSSSFALLKMLTTTKPPPPESSKKTVHSANKRNEPDSIILVSNLEKVLSPHDSRQSSGLETANATTSTSRTPSSIEDPKRSFLSFCFHSSKKDTRR